ncbi:phosphoglucomutase/phosphomannomutase family protein [Microcoleus sp. FACHB-1515]|uniref:phosphoglucomutase/phosphomannomutase family protein n=1 Tax=Cyanophyceae TaxID=3028117 RepID=UPI001684455D|nr:phosphoglucomutase/phosphomannomutase family protein [Microcoleus sp. FACHB-1515]MBD2088539.1 phosphoglucomutase/phosphomannomutase family protein [Microcoleus sp. FACHB-1515]
MPDSEAIEFGTDGWRGIIAENFTFANVCKVTRAIARYLETAYDRDRPVLVGYDTRFLAESFAQTAAEILAAQGWSVRMVDRDCPTPVLAYCAREFHTVGALMFTASHNPAIYCGIKYIPDYAGPATTEITDAIAAFLDAAEIAVSEPGTITAFNPAIDYQNYLLTLLDCDRLRQAHLLVKYDALYSTSRGYLDVLLRQCGCRVETLHDRRDVLFGGGVPEPNGEQLRELVQAVQCDRADLGVATDGDSDRFGIVDEQGNRLEPIQVLLVLVRHLVEQKGQSGAIVRTVATTHLLDSLAQHYGLKSIETAVGFKHIGQVMRQTEVLIGGEESGGLSIGSHIPEKDGILAGLLVAEAIACAQKPLSVLVAEVIAIAGGMRFNYRIDYCLNAAAKQIVLATFQTDPPLTIAGVSVQSIGHKDGVKLYLEDDSWVLLRASGTEPLLRVYVEARSPLQQQQMTAQLKDFIDQILTHG